MMLEGMHGRSFHPIVTMNVNPLEIPRFRICTLSIQSVYLNGMDVTDKVMFWIGLFLVI
jgi:hypothetical protein